MPKTIWKNEIVCNVVALRQVEDGAEYYVDERKISMFNLTTNEVRTLDISKFSLGSRIFKHTESLVPVGNIHIE